ncbi:hypothetical protein HPB51_003800 [Rhipicephalus microplus]|uniref:Transposable element n=1 Tax=Rhipicephalus microplus TaxID=6941 RepID=A0A9J6EEN6_RHIMP|nr:hypothetical protein HPB51_003800 [Rhipicephalus microplus]
MTGRVLEVSLKVPRLRSGSVPTLFPGCPSYLSKDDPSPRECPETKKMRREAADLARAIAESEASYRDEETKCCFSSLFELMECLKSAPVPNEWIVIHRTNCALFLNIVDESMPMLRSSVTVFSDLSISVCFHGTKLSRIGDYVVPGSIGNVNVLSAILSRLQSILDEKCSSEGLCDVVVSLLEQLERDAIDSKKRISRFLREQVALLGKQRLEYSSESMVVACILHTISPHAYKFLRGSGFFAMPHPSTCRNVCSSFHLSPDTESASENFLRYIKHRFKQLQPHESAVVLMVDEIHIQPFFDFKGGNISGAAGNSEEAATSAHVFMVQSMLSSFREVVHILPARTMNAHSLHAVLKNVCALHFTESCIQNKSSYTYPMTGRVLEVSLKVPRLRSGSVPTLFPGCPSYLSKDDPSPRECPETKKMRREAADLARAIAESEASYRDEETKCCFSSLFELMECLKSAPVPNEWIVIHRTNCALFLNIVDESMPMLRSSVTVFSDLSISVCFHGTELSRIGDYVVPGSIGNVNVLSAILSRLQSILDEKCSSEGLCDVVVSLLEQLERDAIDSKKRISRFLREQVALLGKQRLEYSSESMVVACILHTISPHAYKFLRGSGFFAMPHPSTCRNVCSSFHLSPDTESASENFLRYIKHRFKQLQPHESAVVLMVDEIHIQPFFDFKGGKISGAAGNSEEAATSAHVFMVQSMLSSFREVVHILPARTMNAHSLHAVLKNVIIGLEEIGFKVLAVVSDNNAINRKALSMFSDPPKPSIV